MPHTIRALATAIGAMAITVTALADSGYLSYSRKSLAAVSASPHGEWTEQRMKNARPMQRKKTRGLALASAGTAGLDFTRSRITPQSANKASPYKAVGKLFFTIPGDGDYVCSASVIRSRLIVTAAHCIYSNGNFHDEWTFVPAFDGTKNGAEQRPFGSWDWNHAIVPSNWAATEDTLPNNTDFGILELADKDKTKIAARTGKLATAVGHLSDTHVTMLGYPCNLDDCKIMQRVDSSDHEPGTSDADNNAFEYGSDMSGGSSGGPWVENFGTGAAPTGDFDTRNAVVGVTSYGYLDDDIKAQGASQFNADFTAILNTACKHRSGNC